MAFQDYVAELAGYVPRVPIPLAKTLVNRAWRDIRDSRLWSFLVAEGNLISPQIIVSGSVAVTQYQPIITFDAPARAAIAALPAGGPVVTQCHFRVGGGGPLFSIFGYNGGTGVATLERGFQDTSNSLSTFQIYKAYYQPSIDMVPSAQDFLRFASVYDPAMGYALSRHYTKTELDRRDPLRGAVGQPILISAYKSNPQTGEPIFEMWPHPTFQRSYMVLYERKGMNFVGNNEALPAIIPDELLMQRARHHVYEWAESNKGLFPELAKTDWRFLGAKVDGDYKLLLQKTVMRDEETFQQNWLSRPDQSFRSPIDANYAMSHDVSW